MRSTLYIVSLFSCLALFGCERRVDLGFDKDRPHPSVSDTTTDSGTGTSSGSDTGTDIVDTAPATDTQQGSAH